MGTGKRAGARQRAGFRTDLLVLGLGITFAVVAWGYLVFAAIDFGATARQEGKAGAWFFLGLASLGAMACLFLGLLLAVRFGRAVGLAATPEPKPKRDPAASRGGKRAAR